KYMINKTRMLSPPNSKIKLSQLPTRPPVDRFRRRYHVAHAAENLIFITRLRSDNAVPAETASDGIVRNRIIREQLLNQRREWNGIKARQDSIVGIGIRHKRDTSQPQRPAKTFVMRKNERVDLQYGTAEQ